MLADSLKCGFVALGVMQAREDTGPYRAGAGVGDLHGFELGHGAAFQLGAMIPDPLPLRIGHGQAAQFASRAGLRMDNHDCTGSCSIFSTSFGDFGDAPVKELPGFYLEKDSAGRIVQIFYDDAFGIWQPATIADDFFVECDGVGRVRRSFGQVDVLAVRLQLRTSFLQMPRRSRYGSADTSLPLYSATSQT